MPLIRIDALRAGPDRLTNLGRAVHDALVETIGIPPDDLFQVLTSHDGTTSTMRYGGFPGIERDDDVVFIAITLRAGRPDQVKQAMYRRIAELVHDYTGTDPRNVLITLTENASPDWSFANGEAQYL
ncbi:tautomerase family protein [Kribbella capetownensis]|uniref:Tautomerase family protein n=1 Tax=Kribbella capetownensis TaxID=1572659 RepID=A0A4R0JN63_9ACTN|nr:tautomerase family protein [Kribbella capetownensis]TCC47830.1 tautomerase family protein [Kribbella capetownensis]